jgi:hypothetical protein
MTLTPIQVLQEASELRLTLGFEPPDTLAVQPANRCPKDFVPVLKAHKPSLLALLQLPFVMVFSQILDETIFLAEDDAAKSALVQAGADPWSIYTRGELRILVAQNRAKPFLPDELCKVHEIKRTFHGSIATDNGR